MTDNTVKVQITATYSELQTAFTKARDAVNGACESMKAGLKNMSDSAKKEMKGHETATMQFANILRAEMKGVEGAVKGVQIAWRQLAVIFEAGRFLGETVSKTVELTTEAQKLGRALGTNATNAGYLAVAIKSVHGTTEEYLVLTKGLDKQLRLNEAAMNDAGLATRDANGHLKDQQTLTLDALQVLRSYKEGTDRNIEAAKLFGKGVEVSSELLSLNSEAMVEAKKRSDELGLAIGQDDVEASDRFRSAMNDMHEIINALMKTIGDALLPVLIDLADWFSDNGPAALLTIRIAIDIVISLFKGMALAVKVLWEIVALAFHNMVEVGQGFAQVFSDLFHGDFAGAKEAAEGMMTSMAQNMGQAFDNIMKSAAATGSAVTDMWDKTINGTPKKAAEHESGGTRDVQLSQPHDTSAADARKANAELQKALKERYDLVQEELRGEEQAARDSLQAKLAIQQKELAAAIAMYGEKSKEAEKFENAIAETKRQIAEQDLRMQRAAADSQRQIELMQLEDMKSDAQVREQNGQITYAELLQQERDYEDSKFNLLMQGLQEEADANIARVEDHQQTLLKMEELSAQHAIAIGNIEQDAAQVHLQTLQNIENLAAGSFSRSIMGLINKTMTWKQAVLGAFASITQGMLQMFANWAAKQLAHYLMDRLLHKTTLITKLAAEKAAAAASIATAAGIAGANGVASMALAPWPLDMTAPAFGAAMALAASSFGAVASAESGFDIPAGMNPLTQLHQKEMVLPERYADVVRGMADSGGGGGGVVNYHIHAVDAQSFQDLLQRNPKALAEGIKRAHRQGLFVGAG